MKKYKENEEHRDNFQREQRARKKEPTVIVDGAESQETFSDMFGTSGHADLAMARKANDLSGNTA
jgi:hypothetical protein